MPLDTGICVIIYCEIATALCSDFRPEQLYVRMFPERDNAKKFLHTLTACNRKRNRDRQIEKFVSVFPGWMQI